MSGSLTATATATAKALGLVGPGDLTPSPAWAALSAAAAVGLLLAPRREPVVPSTTRRDEGRRGGRRMLARRVGLATALPVTAALLVAPEVVPVVIVAVLAALGGWALWRRREGRVAAARNSARVVELCEQLAAELAAGQPPDQALARAAAEWSFLAPASEAARMGADVPGALRRLAAAPGTAELRWVAAAWQVAHRTGQGLADSVDRVAVELRAGQATQRVVAGELASARATARLVAVLPLGALVMGSGMGGDPWHFLLHTPVGLGCLAAGLLLGWLGLWWIESIARGVGR
ncbi:type II secretion system F family protein [Nocardioides insulae]|uniref:type II secretion system F family protein n=1 Tax=Nocardioides insulae TaxID=394734 RepID=UPI000404FACB|nr:type II secretion system F family protein [Nocardioides insulae]